MLHEHNRDLLPGMQGGIPQDGAARNLSIPSKGINMGSMQLEPGDTKVQQPWTRVCLLSTEAGRGRGREEEEARTGGIAWLMPSVTFADTCRYRSDRW